MNMPLSGINNLGSSQMNSLMNGGMNLSNMNTNNMQNSHNNMNLQQKNMNSNMFGGGASGGGPSNSNANIAGLRPSQLSSNNPYMGLRPRMGGMNAMDSSNALNNNSGRSNVMDPAKSVGNTYLQSNQRNDGNLMMEGNSNMNPGLTNNGLLNSDHGVKEGGVPQQQPNTVAKKPVGIYRVTKNQTGTINISFQMKKGSADQKLNMEGTPLRPGTYMEVDWELPVEEFYGQAARDADFVIGLVRYGAGSNSPGVVSKSLDKHSKGTGRSKDMFGNDVMKGRVQFHAPKSAGVFVYRLFDAQSKERSMYTLATSIAFVVELGDTDVTTNLRHSLDSLLDKAYARGLVQLNSTIKGLRGPGKPIHRDHPQVLLQKCLYEVFNILEEGIEILDKAAVKEKQKNNEEKAARAAKKKEKEGGDGEGGDDPDSDVLGGRSKSERDAVSEFKSRVDAREEEEFWATVKSANRLQSEIHDTMINVKSNRITVSLLTESQKVHVDGILARYCRILHRHFKTVEEMEKERLFAFGFLPSVLLPLTLETTDNFASGEGSAGSKVDNSDIIGEKPIIPAAPVPPSYAQLAKANLPPAAVVEAKINKKLTPKERSVATVDQKIEELLPTLIPSSAFDEERESLRRRIEKSLSEENIWQMSDSLPEGTKLELFGSSKNQFGNKNADLDMCLVLPLGKDVSADERPNVIELIGECLKNIGMEEVQCRSTARIPIVQFVDPVTHMECDISFNNPLAVTNTKLLAAYSKVDPRVRPLAYIIKAWAKAREMNCPGEGTLSSYGYILLILHYLQTRSPAVIPNLQRLPAEWDGSYMEPSTANRVQAIPDSFDVELNPADNTACRTYYYQPPDDHMEQKLFNFGSKNQESVCDLLIGFFRYYAYDFDYRSTVVSVQAGGPITKISKAEIDGWPLHERLSIEDPFETNYDVAHVIKGHQMVFLHKELLRAYALICRSNLGEDVKEGSVHTDTLPSIVQPSALLDALLEPIQEDELPRFMIEARERQEQYKARLAAEMALQAEKKAALTAVKLDYPNALGAALMGDSGNGRLGGLYNEN